MQVTVTKALLVILTQFNKCYRIDVHDRIMVNHSSAVGSLWSIIISNTTSTLRIPNSPC